MTYICRICGTGDQKNVHKAREMMIGLRDEFHYLECDHCGALTLTDPPKQWQKYYPSDYYSMRTTKSSQSFKKKVQQRLLRYLLLGSDSIGHAAALVYGNRYREILNPRLVALIELRKKWPQFSRSSRILDVGAGNGQSFLAPLAELGFTDLHGVDAHLEQKYEGQGYTVAHEDILKLSTKEKYDIITMHHSLEHVADQDALMKQLKKLLRPDGVIIIRIPVKSKYLWERYHTNWVELDAPRHHVIHTPQSLAMVADRAGLDVVDSYYDSTDFQFTGSEQYKKNVPLHDMEGAKNLGITKSERSFFRNFSRKLNEDKQGGRAVFYLRHQQ